MRAAIALLLVNGLVGWPMPTRAHGGGLNADGCHTNLKTGEYHCHQPSLHIDSVDMCILRNPAMQQRVVPSPAQELRSVGSELVFRNCEEVRRAGVAPLRRGNAGYGVHLDRDGDGVACE